MRDLDSKSLEAKDKERDSTIDIYQLAMTYQRKVEEFESLLTDYAGDSVGLSSQVHALKIELQTLQALTGIEQCKVDTYKEQIGMAEERIKHYKKQRDDKEQAGELIYNQIRDAISYQEERWKTG